MLRAALVMTALGTFLSLVPAVAWAADLPNDVVSIDLYEGIPAGAAWADDVGERSFSYTQPTFAFVGLPKKYNAHGVIDDRTNPFLLRARARIDVSPQEAGQWQFLLRAKSAARLLIDGHPIAQTEMMSSNGSGHEAVPELAGGQRPDLRPLPPGCQEWLVTVDVTPGKHEFQLDAIVGGKGLRLELEELCVATARGQEPFQLFAAQGIPPVAVTDRAWYAHAATLQASLRQVDAATRRRVARQWEQYWERRHAIAREFASEQPVISVPDLPPSWPVHNDIDRFVGAQLAAAGIRPADLVEDYEFLRRVTLDTTGLVPTREQIAELIDDVHPQRRSRAIDRLLDDPSWADHWVGYWQDVLAENPGILKPKLNNSGPFRWWIHESFLDNKPLDRLVTELVLMEGSKYYGGPAGFGMATQNDVPLAAKAHVLAKAFLGIEMKCARCHDAPYHPFKQQQLFSLAAMLHRKPLELPKTSTVPGGFGGRVPRIQVSLKPGAIISPTWPFPQLAPTELSDELVLDEDNPRSRLASMLTSPHNRRFAQVMVNRLWKRYLGRGLVDPVDDWEAEEKSSHPGLLDYLAHEFVTHGYDLKHVARLILNSHAYQRRIVAVEPEQVQWFATPVRRRMTAEQLVDSLFAVAGKSFSCEPLTLDPEGRRPVETFLNLGAPTRSWQFTSLSNERDRPALALPVAQSIIDLLVMFGWRDARPNPLTDRDETPTVLQPLALANGVIGRRAVRLSDDSALTELCLEEISLPSLIQQVYLQVLSRPASDEESTLFLELLADGYQQRVRAGTAAVKKRRPRTAVSWSNHLSAEATKIKLELERAVHAGDPPTPRLDSNWRERMEDMVWALVNSPEFTFVP